MAPRRRTHHRALEPATQFAYELRDVLNATVCNGAVVGAVIRPTDGVITVGTNLDDMMVAQPVPLCIDRKKPKCWFAAQFQCDVDDRGFLRVLSSYFEVYAHDGMTPLCHYDYERNKEGYPAAHVQIEGSCAALGELPGKRKANELHKLHFPVGGRRYRPTVEDMIEFVASERFAQGRPGWQEVIDEHRRTFHKIQLRAAVRRHPDIAREVLAEIDGTGS